MCVADDVASRAGGREGVIAGVAVKVVAVSGYWLVCGP